MTEITQLLERAAQGDDVAANRLMPIIYERLRNLTHRELRRDPCHRTLETRRLVHGAYLDLFGGAGADSCNRGRFFAYASKTMRHILIMRANQRLADKHGGSDEKVDIAEITIAVDGESMDVLALDRALLQMAQEDHPRLVRVIELRFFAGLSMEDTAASLNLDPCTIERDWQNARAFIHRELQR